MFMAGCTAITSDSTATVPDEVRLQFTSAPMYGSTAVLKQTVPFDEYAKRRAAGEVVETILHDGFIYYLIQIPWSWPMEDGGGHSDGEIFDGIYRTRIHNETEQSGPAYPPQGVGSADP